MGGHILFADGEWTDWKPCAEAGPDTRFHVTCCNRRHPGPDTEWRVLEEPLEDEDGEPTFAAYAGLSTEFRCRAGTGCTVNPGMRRTRHLREGWYCE